MKVLTNTQIEQVSGAGALLEICTTVAGSALGAATAISLFTGVNVAWLGLVPISLPLAGGFIGGAIGHTIYNMDQYTSNLANTNNLPIICA